MLRGTVEARRKRWLSILESAAKALSAPEECVEEADRLIAIARGPRCRYLCASRTSRVLAPLFLWLAMRKRGIVPPGGLRAVAEACNSSYLSVMKSWYELRDRLAECPDFVWINSFKRSG